jgi:RES domain
MGHPGLHPGPPPDLRLRSLAIREFSGHLYRTHRKDRPPVFFGRTGRNRFDDPRGEYGLLYAALDEYGAFIETFGQSTGNRTLSTPELAGLCLARLSARRPLRLVDLAASGSLARIGADSRLFAGEHSAAQSWSRAFYEDPLAVPDGILYPARHDPSRIALAIFDRAPTINALDSLSWHDSGPLRPLLGSILDHYGFEVVETVLMPERKKPGRATEMTQRSLFD